VTRGESLGFIRLTWAIGLAYVQAVVEFEISEI